MGQVVFVAHVTVGAEVVVEAGVAFPAYTGDGLLPAPIAYVAWMLHACRRKGRGGVRGGLGVGWVT